MTCSNWKDLFSEKFTEALMAPSEGPLKDAATEDLLRFCKDHGIHNVGIKEVELGGVYYPNDQN